MSPTGEKSMEGSRTSGDAGVVGDVVQHDSNAKHLLKIPFFGEFGDVFLLSHDPSQVVVREGIKVQLLSGVIDFHFLRLELLQSIPLSINMDGGAEDVDSLKAPREDIEQKRNDEYSLARAGWRNADHTRRKLRDVLVFRLRTLVVDRRMGTGRGCVRHSKERK